MTDLFGGALPITLAAQITEIEREIKVRRRVYPRFVQNGQISQAAADRQLAVMEAVADTLRGLAARAD